MVWWRPPLHQPGVVVKFAVIVVRFPLNVAPVIFQLRFLHQALLSTSQSATISKDLGELVDILRPAL